MKFTIIFFVLFSTYCYCDRLLGGWTESDDNSLKSFWLSQGIEKIYGLQSNNDLQSKATDLKCKTQIVNGLNIKCTFVINGEKWECSYYQSFVQTIRTKVDECNKIEDEQGASEDKENQQVVAEQKETEQDDEDEELRTANKDEKEEQSIASNKDNEPEEPPAAAANEDEKEKQVAQESLIANEDEDDDEAQIDALNKEMSEQNAKNQEEEEQQQQQ